MSAVYPTGNVFLDANIFLFDVFADPGYGAYCRDLILKVEDEEIMGITSVMVMRVLRNITPYFYIRF